MMMKSNCSEKKIDSNLDDNSDSDQEKEINYYDDAQQFLEFCRKDKNIKLIQEQVPFDQNCELFDISLYKGGPLEDKKYSSKINYRINIRRGNSVCQINNENNSNSTINTGNHNNQKETFIIRRGMQKFYDMQPEYIQENSKINKYHQRVKKLILSPIENFFNQKLQNNQKMSVSLYKLFKENGEHCQISFTNRLGGGEEGAWLIASKNVTILARNMSDLDFYKKERFYWAKLIAEEWFRVLNGISNEQKVQLQQQMNNYTFIGEYCGYEKKQHITQYKQIQIIFYAIVDKNNLREVCLPVEKAKQIFEGYKLAFVKVEVIENITSFEQYKDQLNQIMIKTASGDMETEGEGAVAYSVGVIQVDENVQNQNTLSLCKLKTVEYRIYRKLREMLKLNYIKPIGNKNEKFQFEIQQESKHNLPPLPLEYYYELGRLAFKKVDNDKMDWETLRYLFVSFIEEIKKSEQFQQFYDQLMQQKKPLDSQNSMKDDISASQQFYEYVVITPPAFLSDCNIDSLIQQLGIQEIGSVFREEKGKIQFEKNKLYLLHMVPRISNNSKNKNIIFIVIGFNNIGFQFTLNYLKNNKKEIENSKYASKNQQVFQYLQSQDQCQSLTLLFKKIESFKQELSSLFGCDQFIINEVFEQVSILSQINAIKNKQNKDEILDQSKENQIIKKLDEENIANKEQQQEENLKKEIEQSSQVNLVIVSVFSIPGAGKTFFGQQLKQQVETHQTPFTNFFGISSDKIRQSLMKELAKKRKENKQPEISQEELFKQTASLMPQKFKQILLNILNKIKELMSDKDNLKTEEQENNIQKQKKVILYLDRNNVPNKAFTIITWIKEQLDSFQCEHIQKNNVRYVAVVPETENCQFQMAKAVYPFSIEFLLHSIERVLNKRKEHETMEQDDMQAVLICMGFFCEFKNYNFSRLLQFSSQSTQNQNEKIQDSLQEQQQNKFDFILRHSMTKNKFVDQIEQQNSKVLMKLLGMCLKSAILTPNGKFEFDIQKVSQFIQQFYTLQFEIAEDFDEVNKNKQNNIIQFFQQIIS